MRRRLLLTVDEARAAFVSSALELLRTVDCDLARTLRLLGGGGRTTGFGPRQRRVISAHRMLVQTLKTGGLDYIVAEELDGLGSLLRREWQDAIASRAS